MDMDTSISLGSVADTVGRATRYAAKAEGIDFAKELGGRMSGDTFMGYALEAAIQAQGSLAEVIAALETELAKEGAA